ncbi:hypothetical protein RJ641_036047 [Dillenia turbinata]|uniref:Uncharacterized protein n=1 Tax=Dillenia turbinata TaxID=194707 RepID=A0AAN8ZGJ8_9MAGN
MGSSVTRPLPVHIPSWLPKFLDPRTYQTGIEGEKEEMQNRVGGELGKTVERKERELEMGMKRPKIRFRIANSGGGIDLRSGICRGKQEGLYLNLLLVGEQRKNMINPDLDFGMMNSTHENRNLGFRSNPNSNSQHFNTTDKGSMLNFDDEGNQ